MGDFPSSMAATTAPRPESGPAAPAPPSRGVATPVWIVALIVVAAAAAGAGFFGGYEYKASTASRAATVNDTLSILGAGTLTSFFPTLASDLAAQNKSVSAPAAAQTYEGSLDVTTAITSLASKADVAAVADFRLVPQLLEPKFAGYEVVFASSPEVLVYNASISAFDGINTTNWGTVLYNAVSTAGVPPLAVWNASTDPNGYNEIFDMMLQGVIYGGGNNASVYSHFYSGAVGGYATPNPSVTKIEHESEAATLLKTGVVSALITYRSYAVANHLTNVSFNPIVGLGANNTTALSDYKQLSTEILSSSGTLTPVKPAPVLFAATVPLNAPNPALGAAFLHLLISPEGAAVLSAGGAFTPIFPAWSDAPANVPPVLAPDVTTLPAWAQGYLS
jgi:molybdate/tungstate transport system substrate-binding protein